MIERRKRKEKKNQLKTNTTNRNEHFNFKIDILHVQRKSHSKMQHVMQS